MPVPVSKTVGLRSSVAVSDGGCSSTHLHRKQNSSLDYAPPSPLSSLPFPRKLASHHIASPASGSFLSHLRVRLIHQKQARDEEAQCLVTLGTTETTIPVSPRGCLAPPTSCSARGGGAGLSSAKRRESDTSLRSFPTFVRESAAASVAFSF